ncbi:MAG: tRNA (guanosine(46)-N7)-methyltransferase TrmB [Clostridia bacterium]|nr:tRNA (guanosine(46)-N7)-methyltransferase TrmB [Clostridia bacterium]
MRKKKHSEERIEACSELLIRDPLSCREDPSAVFGKKIPMLLELGCGKGDFANGLSSRFPDHGIIAIERVPDVAMMALEKAAANAAIRPDNLRFIIGHAQYLSDWFPPHSFERIYVNFCDPWPKKGYHKRRLTAPSFLQVYRSLLVPGGELHFKTDNEPLFDWSLEQFDAEKLETVFVTRDLHNSELAEDNIMTEYERHFSSMGMNIFSAHVRFPESSTAIDHISTSESEKGNE